jgi:sporulation protein YlmC with PRC-barrel domain
MLLIRDLLDRQLVDRDGEPMGRVDAVVLEPREGAPPRVVEMQLGFVPLAHRFGPRVANWVERLHRRWSVRRSARYSIPWSDVLEVHQRHIQVRLLAAESPAHDWERWLRQHVIGRLPGSGKE